MKLNDYCNKTVAQLEYASAIGNLMHVKHCTRPNIAFTICKLSRYTSKPNMDHWKAIASLWLSKKNNRFRFVLLWFSNYIGMILWCKLNN
jgi:hypothetical protein